jgi:hypothetical protein
MDIRIKLLNTREQNSSFIPNILWTQCLILFPNTLTNPRRVSPPHSADPNFIATSNTSFPLINIKLGATQISHHITYLGGAPRWESLYYESVPNSSSNSQPNRPNSVLKSFDNPRASE